MPITTRNIANIGSPPADPTCPLPGILYVPDTDLFPGPYDCVVGTVAGHFTTGNLNGLDRPFRDLATQGFLCLAFNVRLLSPGIPGQTTTGIYPQQTDDFKIGIQFMRNDPGGFGYLVTGWVGALGGSGSAHHALFSALDGTIGDDRADAAVCMSPLTDASDREDDVTQAFIDKSVVYFDSTDLPTLLARSPISLSLQDMAPVLHFNGDNEAMPLSQLTRFRDGGASDIITYTARINTGTVGQLHSFAMWPSISAEAIAFLFQYSGAPVPVPPPEPPPEELTVTREGSFRRIYNRIMLKLGEDPYKPIPYEITRAVISHINERVSIICPLWRWPDWEVTEERAFRQIWSSTRQFLLVSSNGRPDEVFYLGDDFVVGGALGTNSGYYRASGTADPPIGTLPTNTSYWTEITPIDTFIEYNQTCKRPIGMVLSVFSHDPRIPTGSNNGLMRFQPSEKGLDVFYPAGPTVFITYKKPVPRYTMTPIKAGYPYLKNEVGFDPQSGECFQAVAANKGEPTSDTASWRLLPFPDSWANYVVEGALADSISELVPGGAANIPTNLALAAKAEMRAEKGLAVAADTLLIQGQTHQHNVFRSYYMGCCCTSQPWTIGTAVTTLTDECEDGPPVVTTIPPSPTDETCDTTFHHEIVAVLTADGSPSLEELATVTRKINCTKISIAIDTGGSIEEQSWLLVEGTADPLDSGQTQPDDYDASDNSKHWVRVG